MSGIRCCGGRRSNVHLLADLEDFPLSFFLSFFLPSHTAFTTGSRAVSSQRRFRSLCYSSGAASASHSPSPPPPPRCQPLSWLLDSAPASVSARVIRH